jgi:hypothetical protein
MWPSIAEVREWGYDEEAEFMEQDEDLLLYGFEYLSVLGELASDNDCPKSEYAFAVLCQFSRNRITRGSKEDQQRLAEALRDLPPMQGRAADWRLYLEGLLQLIEHPRPLTNAEARKFANDLLLGPGRVGQLIEEPSLNDECLRIKLVTSLLERVEINLAKGTFEYHSQYGHGAV